MRITIIQQGLRESGSSGDGVWVADQQLWFVTLDRASPPFRGYYAADEVALHRPQDGEVFAQLPAEEFEVANDAG